MFDLKSVFQTDRKPGLNQTGLPSSLAHGTAIQSAATSQSIPELAFRRLQASLDDHALKCGQY